MDNVKGLGNRMLVASCNKYSENGLRLFSLDQFSVFGDRREIFRELVRLINKGFFIARLRLFCPKGHNFKTEEFANGKELESWMKSKHLFRCENCGKDYEEVNYRLLFVITDDALDLREAFVKKLDSSGEGLPELPDRDDGAITLNDIKELFELAINDVVEEAQAGVSAIQSDVDELKQAKLDADDKQANQSSWGKTIIVSVSVLAGCAGVLGFAWIVISVVVNNPKDVEIQKLNSTISNQNNEIKNLKYEIKKLKVNLQYVESGLGSKSAETKKLNQKVTSCKELITKITHPPNALGTSHKKPSASKQ